MDISIFQGVRSREEQDWLINERKSKVQWPNGKHNVVAKGCWINIRWGGNWDQDGEPVTDQDFQDLMHYEIVE